MPTRIQLWSLDGMFRPAGSEYVGEDVIPECVAKGSRL